MKACPPDSPRTIVFFSPGLHEDTIWGEKLVVRGQSKHLRREFPDAQVLEFGLEDLDQIAGLKVDLLISYYTGPRPPWRFDNIADLVDAITILNVVNHADLLHEFARVPVDGFITNSVAAVKVLEAHRPAICLPLAVEDDYGPVEPQEHYLSDVVFLGSGGRGNKRPATTMHYLQGAKKFDFALWGNNWDRDYWAREYEATPEANNWFRFWRGRLPLDDIGALYSSAKIVLNFHEDSQRQWGMWNNRVFEAMGCGALMICDEADGLREEFGDAIVFTSGGDETARLIAHYLERPEERRRRGEIGRKIVRERYLYSQWARRVHEFYDLLNAQRRHGNRLAAPSDPGGGAQGW
jgi:glycosyltransferase involved in cell wall biosynthesis